MQTFSVVVVCLLVGVAVQYVKGNCFYTPVRMDISAVGTTHYYCDYNKTKDNVTVTFSMSPGSEFRTDDCMECQCARAGLRCCGYGIKAGTPTYIPPECKIIADGCKPVVVLKSDNVTDCYTGQPIKLSRQNMMMMNMMKTLTMPQNGNGGGGMTEEAIDGMMKYMLISPLLTSLDSPNPGTPPTSGSGPTLPNYGSSFGNLGLGNNMFGNMLFLRMFGEA